MRRLLVLAMLLLPLIAYAGCISDCRDDFDSEADSCKLLYDGPDETLDLTLCIDSARGTYESCVDDCQN